MCFQQQIQQPCQKRLTMAPTTLLTIADNASAAFPASLLSAFTSLFNQLLKLLYLLVENLLLLLLFLLLLLILCSKDTCNSKWNCWDSYRYRAASTEIMVLPCSRNTVRNLSAKDVPLSGIFSIVRFIFTTCVLRSFQFCDSISSLVCFLVYKSSMAVQM